MLLHTIGVRRLPRVVRSCATAAVPTCGCGIRGRRRGSSCGSGSSGGRVHGAHACAWCCCCYPPYCCVQCIESCSSPSPRRHAQHSTRGGQAQRSAEAANGGGGRGREHIGAGEEGQQREGGEEGRGEKEERGNSMHCTALLASLSLQCLPWPRSPAAAARERRGLNVPRWMRCENVLCDGRIANGCPLSSQALPRAVL